MSDGLAFARWLDPVEEFVRTHGHRAPRWAIICTYECDLDLLARDVAPALTGRGRAFRCAVLADAGALETQLARGAELPQARINVHPVRVAGGAVFHPKLVLLRAGENLRAVFGSANLTRGGFGGNLELWASSDDPEITAALAQFVDALRVHPGLQIDAAAKRAIRRALLGVKPRDQRATLTSGKDCPERAPPDVQRAAARGARE